MKGNDKEVKCFSCGAKDKLEVHHIVPISKKGTNEPENLVILCQKCHRSIGTKVLPIIGEQFKINQFGGNGERDPDISKMLWKEPRVRISVDIDFDTFVKLEVRTARERISKAELIRGFIGGWLEEGDNKNEKR